MKLYYKIVLRSLTILLFVITYFKKKRLINRKKCYVKVNLGSGLKVHKEWINIDYNLPSLVAGSPIWVLNFIFDILIKTNYSELDRPYRFSINKQQFVKILKENTFVAHNLKYGIPFMDYSVHYFYSSHMIGFSFPKETSKFLLKEIYRTLTVGGKLRLSFDGPIFGNKKSKRSLNQNSYSYNEIKLTLEEVGFSFIKRYRFQEGTIPDLDVLDDYSPEIDRLIGVETIYLEAEK
jgi:hypothetical protein